MRSGTAGEPSQRAPAAYQFVSPEYFNVLGIDVVRGRGFSRPNARGGGRRGRVRTDRATAMAESRRGRAGRAAPGDRRDPPVAARSLAIGAASPSRT